MESSCSTLVLRIPSFFRTSMTQTRRQLSLCTFIATCSQCLSYCIEILVYKTIAPQKGIPLGRHQILVIFLLLWLDFFSQCLAYKGFLQPWLHVRMFLELQMYRSLKLPVDLLSQNLETVLFCMVRHDEGIKNRYLGSCRSKSSRTSARLLPFLYRSFLASHLIEVWTTFLIAILKQLRLQYSILFVSTVRILEEYTWIVSLCGS